MRDEEYIRTEEEHVFLLSRFFPLPLPTTFRAIFSTAILPIKHLTYSDPCNSRIGISEQHKTSKLRN